MHWLPELLLFVAKRLLHLHAPRSHLSIKLTWSLRVLWKRFLLNVVEVISIDWSTVAKVWHWLRVELLQTHHRFVSIIFTKVKLAWTYVFVQLILNWSWTSRLVRLEKCLRFLRALRQLLKFFRFRSPPCVLPKSWWSHFGTFTVLNFPFQSIGSFIFAALISSSTCTWNSLRTGLILN